MDAPTTTPRPSPPSLPARLRDALAALSVDHPEAIEALRPLYADDVAFSDPIQSLDGLEAFLAMNRRLLARVRALTFDVTSAQGTDDEAFLAWSMRATPRLGPAVKVDGVTHARAREGRVFYHRDFWDLGELFASGLPGGRQVLRAVLRPLA
jgi:hypothetical protein